MRRPKSRLLMKTVISGLRNNCNFDCLRNKYKQRNLQDYTLHEETREHRRILERVSSCKSLTTWATSGEAKASRHCPLCVFRTDEIVSLFHARQTRVKAGGLSCWHSLRPYFYSAIASLQTSEKRPPRSVYLGLTFFSMLERVIEFSENGNQSCSENLKKQDALKKITNDAFYLFC